MKVSGIDPDENNSIARVIIKTSPFQGTLLVSNLSNNQSNLVPLQWDANHSSNISIEQHLYYFYNGSENLKNTNSSILAFDNFTFTLEDNEGKESVLGKYYIYVKASIFAEPGDISRTPTNITIY